MSTLKRQLESWAKSPHFFHKFWYAFLDGIVNLILKSLIFVLAVSPVFILQICSNLFAFILPKLARKEQNQLKINIEKIWGLPPTSEFGQAFARQVLGHQIKIFIEQVQILIKGKKPQIENQQDLNAVLQEVKSLSRGIVVVTGHLGSWELLSSLCAQAWGQDVNVLGKPGPLRSVNQIIRNLRKKGGANLLWTDSRSLLKDMLRLLNRGEFLGFVMDQKPPLRQGVSLDFFGHPATFALGPARVALRTEVPVLAAVCVRTGVLRYRILFEWIVSPIPSQITTEEELTQSAVLAIEKWIRLYPEQWTWAYRRWRFSQDPLRKV